MTSWNKTIQCRKKKWNVITAYFINSIQMPLQMVLIVKFRNTLIQLKQNCTVCKSHSLNHSKCSIFYYMIETSIYGNDGVYKYQNNSAKMIFINNETTAPDLTKNQYSPINCTFRLYTRQNYLFIIEKSIEYSFIWWPFAYMSINHLISHWPHPIDLMSHIAHAHLKLQLNLQWTFL